MGTGAITQCVSGKRARASRAFRPAGEGLESRLVPSASVGDWPGSTTAHVERAVAPVTQGADAHRGQNAARRGAHRAGNMDPAVVGSWTPPRPFRPPGAKIPYVAIDLSLLPDGTLISWGHDYDGFLRNRVASQGTPSVMVWNPRTNTYEKHNTSWINLFCGAHSFLADGRLVVAGGHGPAAVPESGLEVAFGHAKVAAFDFRTRTWSQLPSMRAGRYYPSAITLGDGGILVASGNDQYGAMNAVPEVYRDGKGWTSLPGARMTVDLQWYPNMYQLSNGLVFGAVPGPRTFFMDPTGRGRFWAGPTMHSRRYEGTSVMYAPDKVLAIGGDAGGANIRSVESIDLDRANPRWREVAPMRYAREYPNATLLPDGTVLVTGGTSSASNAAGGAIRPAELWNPATGLWTTLAPLTTPRLYHSTGILLPDGRVLVAGGGQPESTGEPRGMTHQDMQIFSPPYLFRGPRPVIASTFESTTYGASEVLTTPDASSLARVTLVGLGSVTHSYNMSQRIAEVPFERVDHETLRLHVPDNSNLVPPGYYMLFVLNSRGVPSISKIVHVGPA
jgi:hypothetical protein